MAKSGYKYRGRSSEDVKARAEQRGGGNWDRIVKGDFPYFKPKDGKNKIRPLPVPWANNDYDEKLIEKWGNSWGIEIYVHERIGPDKGTYLCLAKMKGKPCPICEARSDMEKDEDADDKNKPSKKLLPKKRFLLWLIDRNNEKDGPLWWSMPWTLERDIAIVCQEEDDSPGAALLIDHPDEGYDVTFSKEKKAEFYEYVGVKAARESSSISEKESTQAKWLAFTTDNPLYSILDFKSYEYIEKVYMGKGGKKDDDDEDDDDRPKRRRKVDNEDEDEDGGKSKRSKRDDDDEEDEPKRKKRKDEEDEEDEDDDDDDDSSSRSSRDRKARRSREDEEEDDDDEPKRRSGSRKDRRDRDEDEGDEDGEDEEEDEDEGERKSRLKKDKSKAARDSINKLKKRARDEEDDDD